jgi:hypothetical protein
MMQLDPARYAELVRRMRSAICETLPAEVRVAVISRGDAALLDLPGVSATHFPQDAAGEYAGHHPPSSTDAITHLEQLRDGGVEYLAIPDTARWWLEHYDGFAEHLSNRAELVSDLPGVCVIFRLGRRMAEARGAGETSLQDASIAQMRDYLEHLISTDAHIAVLEPVPRSLADSLGPLRATGLPLGEPHAAEDGLRAELERLAAAGTEYLVVPREADQWLSARADVEAEIRRRCRLLADQRHLCRVFELTDMGET